MTRDNPDLPPLAPATPVLDSEAGVERLMGNRALYLRILARFGNDYRDAAAAIRRVLAAHDTDSAQRLAHTLKGASGIIEAPVLHAAAQALDDALRGGRRDAGPLVLQLEAALAAVLREIDAMEMSAVATPPAAMPPPANALSELRTMLAIGDGAAVELAAAAHGELRAHLGERDYAALSAAVENFDYERALLLLDLPKRPG
ncbi:MULTISPECIES: Hpt domain-containing protein [unclassified Massilia]|uniref:Hpt domain-containing protein n=1 Tax=unclassified Massilia TaxID=2609279 RepID=UPI001784BB60|nr:MULTISPECIES: Hpt domain-containing protein [unclassified Massilia]MBD8533297.1 Hpt domain-containing protein [Massilia sp. CFBP 13647]MBD8676689.1 Hpt domain-containing protein [Massilia sp. CFBP 13721]